MQLIIGDKVWSTWSMRPWLVLKRTGAEFTETRVRLRQETHEMTGDEIEAAGSPSRLVPALRDGDLVVWDSLAICEYLAERFPKAALWPVDSAARAVGRSAMAEMHSGFSALRQACPMDLVLRTRVPPSDSVVNDLQRLDHLWSGLLARFGGPFLLGDWSIADAYFTPVATRIRSYGLAMGEPAAEYAVRLLQTPEFLEWERDALFEVQNKGPAAVSGRRA